ncbi:MAG: DUF438 domain-containing protein [Acidobacteriota bacterium]|nr:MAG: DUF438 domain-containing protein [Acidobacteriota bacterium]
MSELIDNTARRKELLKHAMLELHSGNAPESVRAQLERLMGEIPYEMVVEVEQELLNDGLPAEEILSFCDIHAKVLKGNLTHAKGPAVPPGHPVHTLRKENQALQWELESIKKLLGTDESSPPMPADANERLDQIKARFNNLADVEKHYERKEHLLFPFLEKHGITGPPKVMWGKHDQVRGQLKAAIETLQSTPKASSEELEAVAELVLLPAVDGLEDMIFREEEIFLPLCLDTFNEEEWYEIARQSNAIGYCLFDPEQEWVPSGLDSLIGLEGAPEDRVQLPSGSLTPTELTAILNTIPFDLTFVDAEDRVRYFTQGRERIFTRTRAILGRKVQMCHPPSSVHIVEQILKDFRSGRQSRAPFWINMKGQFIHIEYFALRDKDGKYLGTLEVSQNLTEKRGLEGEQRLLNYGDSEDED